MAIDMTHSEGSDSLDGRRKLNSGSFSCSQCENLLEARRAVIENLSGPFNLAEKSYVLLRLRPESKSAGERVIDMRDIGDDATLNPLYKRAYSGRHNCDGYLKLCDTDGEPRRCYLQIFRDASIETAAVKELLLHQHRRTGHLYEFLEAGLQTIGQYREFCRSMSVTGPVTIQTAFVGLKDEKLDIDARFHGGAKIDRNPLLVPEVRVSNTNGDVVESARHWLDMVCQSVGKSRCPDGVVQKLRKTFVGDSSG